MPQGDLACAHTVRACTHVQIWHVQCSPGGGGGCRLAWLQTLLLQDELPDSWLIFATHEDQACPHLVLREHPCMT